jgi:hypothetical protein
MRQEAGLLQDNLPKILIAHDHQEPRPARLHAPAVAVRRREYCVPVENVREVLRLPEITRLPRQPEFISGITKLRGHAIPVIDLRVRFGLSGETDSRIQLLLGAIFRTAPDIKQEDNTLLSMFQFGFATESY